MTMLTRDEALIEMIKGNKIKTPSGNIIYRKDDPTGKVRFYGKRPSGREEEAMGWLSSKNGYRLVPKTRKITIDDKEIEISEESFQELKKQLVE